MAGSLGPHVSTLRSLTRHDPSPQVRHRAHLLLMLIAAATWKAAAEHAGTGERSLRRWQQRYLDEGRDGLCDRPRTGRPRKVTPEVDTIIVEALEHSPLDMDIPLAVWTIPALCEHLQRLGWSFGRGTIYSAVHRLGYGYHRPVHDLHHRQDAEAVASAAHVLATLQKRGLLAPDSVSSMPMSVTCTPTPLWQRPGNVQDNDSGSTLQE